MTTDLYHTFDGKAYRPLGCKPREVGVGKLFATLEEKVPLIPRSEWKEVDNSHLHWTIIDQDGIGSCNACAAVQALMMARRLAGLRDIELSSGNLYGQINGGRDAGSLLSDALVALKNTGTCMASTIGHLSWRPRQWPDNWREEARKFRILEAFDCPTFDHIASAIQHGYFVDYGIFVGNRFTPDRNGFIPDYRGGFGGHAMCGVGLKYHNSQWYITTINSWGKDWGLNGIAYVPESYFKDSFNDAWALRAAIAEDVDL